MEGVLSSLFSGSAKKVGANNASNTIVKKEPVDNSPVADTVPKKVLERIMKQVVDLENQMKAKISSKDAELSVERQITTKLKKRNEKLELAEEKMIKSTNDKSIEIESLKSEMKLNYEKMDNVLEENRVLMHQIGENTDSPKADNDYNDMKDSLEKYAKDVSMKQKKIKCLEKKLEDKDVLTNELKRKVSMMIAEFTKGVSEKDEEFKSKEAKMEESLKQKDAIIEELIKKNKETTKEHLLIVKEKNKLTVQLATQLKDIKAEKNHLATQVEEVLSEKNKLVTQLKNIKSQNSNALSEENKLVTQLENMKSEKSKLITQFEGIVSEKNKLLTRIENIKSGKNDQMSGILSENKSLTTQLENIKSEKNKLMTQILSEKTLLTVQLDSTLSEKNKLATQLENIVSNKNVAGDHSEFIKQLQNRIVELESTHKSEARVFMKRKLSKKRKFRKKRSNNAQDLISKTTSSSLYSDSEILEASNFLYENTVSDELDMANNQEKKRKKLLMITYLWPVVPYKTTFHYVSKERVNEDADKVEDSHIDGNKIHFDLRFPVNEEDNESIKSDEEDVSSESEVDSDSGESDEEDRGADLELSIQTPKLMSFDILGLYSIKEILEQANSEGINVKHNKSVFTTDDIDGNTKNDLQMDEVSNDSNESDESEESDYESDDSEDENCDGFDMYSNTDQIDKDSDNSKDYYPLKDANTINTEEEDVGGEAINSDLESVSTRNEVDNDSYDSAKVKLELTSDDVDNDSDDDSISSDVEYVNDFDDADRDDPDESEIEDAYNEVDNNTNDASAKTHDNSESASSALVEDDDNSGENVEEDSDDSGEHEGEDNDDSGESEVEDNEESGKSEVEEDLESTSTKEKLNIDATPSEGKVENAYIENLRNLKISALYTIKEIARMKKGIKVENDQIVPDLNKKNVYIKSEVVDTDPNDSEETESNDDVNDKDNDEKGEEDEIMLDDYEEWMKDNKETTIIIDDEDKKRSSKGNLNHPLEKNKISSKVKSEIISKVKSEITSNDPGELLNQKRSTIIIENHSIKEETRSFPHLIDHDYCLPSNKQASNNLKKDSSEQVAAAFGDFIAKARADQISRCKTQADEAEVLKAIESIMPDTNLPQGGTTFQENEVLKAINSIMPEEPSIKPLGDVLVINELDDLIKQLDNDELGKSNNPRMITLPVTNKAPFITRRIIGKDGKSYRLLTKTEQKLATPTETPRTIMLKRKSSEIEFPQDKKVKLAPLPEVFSCDLCGTTFKTKNSLAVHKSKCRPYNKVNSNEGQHCDICGQYCKTKHGLAIHKAKHKREPGFLH